MTGRAEFTKGGWAVHYGDDYCRILPSAAAATDDYLADNVDRDCAPLMAAAPEMFAALEEVRAVLGIRADFIPLGVAPALATKIINALSKAQA